MGYIRHHAILVTGFSLAPVAEAHAEAVRLFAFQPNVVSPIADGVVNGYRSFCIFPDGSKEGWAESDKGNEARAAWKAWALSRRYEDLSSPVDWVEVQYGDGERETRVVDDSDALLREQDAQELALRQPPARGGVR